MVLIVSKWLYRERKNVRLKYRNAQNIRQLSTGDWEVTL